MKTIWKFPLETKDEQSISVPAGARSLCVQTQGDGPYLWAEVDDTAEACTRPFRTYGTGHPMPDDPGEYVGSYQLRSGQLVFHVYEAREA